MLCGSLDGRGVWEKNGYMYIYGGVPLLSTWNCHNIINQLYSTKVKTKQKNLNNPDNHKGVITHLEPDILECEVKWALASITAKLERWWNSSWAISNPKRWCSWSAALSMPANLENSVGSQDWKKSVFIPIPKKGNAKECSNYYTIALISHASKVMLKIL